MDGSMMRLRDIESRLPPGFRFHPSDEELVCYYLRGKVDASSQQSSPQLTMVDVDLHVREPWDLPVAAKVGDKEWYFFSSRDRKYATGSRTNRATRHGYWKATGKDKAIHGCGTTMGMRKTLVFYLGRAPNGRKSDWVMHEFRLVRSTSAAETMPMLPPTEDWVMCRVFHKGKGEDRHGGGGNHLIDMTSSSPPVPLRSPPQPTVAIDGGGGQLFPNSAACSSATITSRGHHLLELVGDEDHHALDMGRRQDAMPPGPATIQLQADDGGSLLEFPEWQVDIDHYGENWCIQEMLQRGGNY